MENPISFDGNQSQIESSRKTIEIRRIDPENTHEIAQFISINDDPQTKRHQISLESDDTKSDELLTPEQRTKWYRDWVASEPIYAIFTNNEMTAAVYFYDYEESDPEESEDIPSMISTKLLDDSMVPRLPNGDIDYKKIKEISLFMPTGTDAEILRNAVQQAISQYISDENVKKGSLLFAFMLRNQESSLAEEGEYVSQDQYIKELETENNILTDAGFSHRGDIETGDVGVFTLTI